MRQNNEIRSISSAEDDENEDGIYSSLMSNLKMGHITPKRQGAVRRVPTTTNIKLLMKSNEDREIS